MNRITQKIQALKQQQRKVLATYIVNGDPTPEITLAAMHALVDAGVDILEIGVPFSDPMAEGPVIQRAHERALAHNTSLRDTLAQVKKFRESDQETRWCLWVTPTQWSVWVMPNLPVAQPRRGLMAY
jgi:tryptophan synthase alpha chain